MLQTGALKPGEICPGVTWEEHADSVARFLDRQLHEQFNVSNLEALRRIVLEDIDGDPKEVRDHYDQLERNS